MWIRYCQDDDSDIYEGEEEEEDNDISDDSALGEADGQYKFKQKLKVLKTLRDFFVIDGYFIILFCRSEQPREISC